MIVSATADPDYYAVEITGEGRKSKIFTKISECTGAVYYHSAENRVLFQDGVLKIGTLKSDFDCKTLSSVVEEEYQNRTKGKESPNTDNWEEWIDIKETNKYGYDTTVWIWIKGFNKSVEVTGMKLKGGTKDWSSWNKEDCLTKDRGEDYPGKDIVVAFHHGGGCSYDSVDQAKLKEEDDDKTIILVHPAGKD